MATAKHAPSHGRQQHQQLAVTLGRVARMLDAISPCRGAVIERPEALLALGEAQAHLDRVLVLLARVTEGGPHA
jgi:hypothetical protein